MMKMEERKRPSELKLVKAVSSLFRDRGYKEQITEAQFCERFIDILCMNKKTKKFAAIEAKVNAPSKAFEQASRYRYIADYVYVAILKNGCNKKAIELSHKTGIGLIFVRRDTWDRYYAEVKIKPKKSEHKDSNLIKYVLE